MGHTDVFEQDEQYLEDQLEEGSISEAEFEKSMKELRADYRDAASDAAQQAYEREIDNW